MVAGKPDHLSFADLEARAQWLESQQRLLEASAAYDAAIELDPASQSCAEGRARIAIELNQEGAAEHCARALRFHEGDPELQEQMIVMAPAEVEHGVVNTSNARLVVLVYMAPKP